MLLHVKHFVTIFTFCYNQLHLVTHITMRMRMIPIIVLDANGSHLDL